MGWQDDIGQLVTPKTDDEVKDPSYQAWIHEEARLAGADSSEERAEVIRDREKRLRKEAEDKRNAPKLKAREAVIQAREGVAEAKAAVGRAEAYVLEWERILKMAEVELERLDPAVRGPRITNKLPNVNTQAHTILLFCRKATTAYEVAAGLNMPINQAYMLLSNAFRADHMVKPQRGYYKTRRNVLVALGVLDNLKADDDA